MDFISVKEARELIIKNVPDLVAHSVKLKNSLGCYTAEDCIAPVAVPHFDNSAMDGYCFAFKDFEEGIPLRLSYIIQAGETDLPVLKRGEAARIFTGAPIPQGADTVIMQEKTKIENDILQLMSGTIFGSNVRLKGSQTEKGELILSKNTFITAGIIGFLAGFGLDRIKIFTKPKIGIIVTGKELVPSGFPLQNGQIYESNSVALQAVLKEKGFDVEFTEVIDDNPDLLEEGIQKRTDQVDVLLITGGISVGDYDFVQPVLQKLNFKKIFYKVKQKPGKPLFFGRKGQKFIFGLPGNPAAVFTCFHEYVNPFLQRFMGRKEDFFTDKAVLLHDFKKNNELTHFVKGQVCNGQVNILSGQESYKMNAFVQANCFVKLEETNTFFKKGEQVEIVKI